MPLRDRAAGLSAGRPTARTAMPKLGRVTRDAAAAKPPVDPEDPRVVIWNDNDGMPAAYGAAVGRTWWMHVPRVGTFRFAPGGDEVEVSAVPPASNDLVLDTFHRAVAPMVLQVAGREVLHASAVRVPSGVIALAAVSETGKSTTASALASRGHELWADDAVALDLGDSEVTALPLPFRPRVRDVVMDEHWRLMDAAPLAAVCALRRDESLEGPACRQLEAAEAFQVLLTHAYCFTLELEARKREMMSTYLELASRVPVFDVSFPTGLENLDRTLDLLEDAAGARAGAVA
jgi:hypothetical protein